MKDKPPQCAGCPASDYGVGFVPPTPPAEGRPLRLVVVGQGPGEQEAEFAQPFYPYAPSGQRLRGWLVDAGGDPRDVAWGNIVMCWMPERRVGSGGRGNRSPTQAEMDYCYQQYVGPWLQDQPAEVPVVAVGAPAARYLLGLGDEAVQKRMGVTHEVELPEVCPT